MKKKNNNYIGQLLIIIIINIIVILVTGYFTYISSVNQKEIIYNLYLSGLFIVFIEILSVLLAFYIGKNNKKLILLQEEVIEKNENIQNLEKTICDEEQYLLDYSVRDQLTGVNNKLYIDTLLQQIDDAKLMPVSILLIDINGLNLINSNFGYDYGDDIVKKISDILKVFVRENDVLARYGFDEFVILMINTPIEYAKSLSKKIETMYEQSHKNEFKTGIAFGIASRTSLDEKFEQVFERAKQNSNIIKLTMENRNIDIFKKALKEKKKESSEHCQRIKLHAVKLGHLLRLPDITLANLQLLAYIHDLGKIATPDFVLNKLGPLDENEREVIKTHPEIGYNIAMTFPHLRNIAIHILQHHERWDGTGYPNRVKGEDITVEARIISIVDAFDAMINNNYYRETYSIQNALLEIEKCAGTQFDPYIANTFIKMIKKENNIH